MLAMPHRSTMHTQHALSSSFKHSLLVMALFLLPSVYESAHANHHEGMPDCNKMAPNFSISYLDDNTDGLISLQEYLQGDSSNEKKMFEHMDANHDGMLDQAEQKVIEEVYKQIHEQAAKGSHKT